MNNPFDKESLSQREKDLLEDGGWQCSFCATVNASYITTCACSHNRDDSYENLHGRYVPREDEEWTEAGITVEGPAIQVEPEVSAASFRPEPEPVSFQPEPSFQSEPAALQPEPSLSPHPDKAFQPEAATPAESASAPTTAPKAPVSNTNKPMEEYSEYEQGILKDGGWECAFCSRINANYITTCACGHSNDDSYLKRRGRYVDPEETEQEETSPEPAQTVSPAPAQTDTEPSTPEETGASLIANIEKELENNQSDVAKIRAIRKFKDLVKKGYMTEEEFNQKKEELLSFDDEEEEEAPEAASESAATEATGDHSDQNEEDA